MPCAKRVKFKGVALINITDNFSIVVLVFTQQDQEELVCEILVKYRVLMMLAHSNVKETYSSAGE